MNIELPRFYRITSKNTDATVFINAEIIKKFAIEQNLTIDVVLLAGYVALLARYCAEKKLSIALTKEKVLAIEVDIDLSFHHILKMVLTPSKLDKDNHPAIYFQSKEPNGDLSLTYQLIKKDFFFVFASPENRFPDRFLSDMAANFQQLLIAILGEPSKPIGNFPCLNPQEWKRVLKMGQGELTSYPRDQTIPEIFEEVARQQENHPALRLTGKTMSYKDLNRQANKLARHFLQCGIKKGDYVGVALPRSIDLIVSLLAILKTGAVCIPIDITYPTDRKRFIFEDTHIKLLVTIQAEGAQIPGFTYFYWDQDRGSLDLYADDNLHIPLSALDRVNILYTSGSTGKPKGVELNHRGFIRTVCQTNWFKIMPKDRMVQIASPAFDVMAAEVWGALLNGATLCIYPRNRPVADELAQFLCEEEITHGFFTAHLFNLLIEYYLSSMKKMRFAASVGENMSVHHACMAFSALKNCRLVNGYGPTENSIFTCCYLIQDLQKIGQSIPIGPPISNCDVYILNSHLQPVPMGVQGEIYVGGDGLANGYFHRPELTRERFIPNHFGKGRLYRTGDLGRFLPTGDIEFLGRKDQQVKIRGFRIELGEIEEALKLLPEVTDCAVLVREESGAPKLVAYLEKRKGRSISEEALRAYAQSKLPDYMVPAFYVFVKKLPLTPNGKIDTKALPAPEKIKSSGEVPQTVLEQIIAETWTDLLNVKDIHRLDDFFLIGGQSIEAAELSSILSRILKIEIPVELLFTATTLIGYAKKVEQLMQQPETKANFSIPAKEMFSTWRDKEVVLDPSIQIASKAKNSQYTHPKNVFLTGATGFIGAFMLKELLSGSMNIHILVRSKTPEHALERIRSNLKQYLLWDENQSPKIVPICGDLEQPLLGLSPTQFDDLSHTIDSIFHVGAFVNHVLPYQRLKTANVLGTQELLRLACRTKSKPFHYFSTTDVFCIGKTRTIPEDHDLNERCDLNGGYAQSKWVAERIVELAIHRGLPANIYRLNRVMGDFQSGAGQTDDFLWRIVEASLLIKQAPYTKVKENLTPVDFVCRSIRALSSSPEWINRPYHILNPHQTSYREIFKIVKELGYPLEETSFEEWKRSLIHASSKISSNRLKAIIPLFSELDPIQNQSTSQFGCRQAQDALQKLHISYPTIDKETIEKYVRYFISIGYFSAPHGKTE